MLIDTHAHIHFDDYSSNLETIFERARAEQVAQIITIGTDVEDSHKAIEFVKTNRPEGIKLFATAGLHPHDAKAGQLALDQLAALARDNRDSIVAIGECGLDYYRNLSSVEDQKIAMRAQIELAGELDLPVVFHVRDAWDDFFAELAQYPKIRGVVHSFTGGPRELEQIAEHKLSIALNGIITFTKLDSQLEAARQIPADKLLLETDCPFLAPQPLRGKRNEPSYLKYTAEFLAKLRGERSDDLAKQTTQNAQELFSLPRD